MTTANSQYSAADLVHQLRDSGAKAIFTCLPLLQNALQAAKSVGIPHTRVFLLNFPSGSAPDASISKKQTTNGLVELGRSQPKLQRPAWSKGEGKRRIAFICYSSGTSGLPVSAYTPLLKQTPYHQCTNPATLERCNDIALQCYSQHNSGLHL